jgi:hypothetical protein
MDEDTAMINDVIDAPPLTNALQLSPGSTRWQPTELSLNDIQALTRMEHDPLPTRIQDDCCLVQIATKSLDAPDGIQSILDLVLELCVVANRVDSRRALEDKLENTLERAFRMANRDFDGLFSYRFCPKRVTPPPPPLPLDLALDEEPNVPSPPSSHERSPSIQHERSPSIQHERSPSIQRERFSPIDTTDAGLDSGNSTTASSTYDGEKRAPVAHIEWFDLMMSAEADDLPDLSDWGVSLP